jgi:hypothetical protein
VMALSSLFLLEDRDICRNVLAKERLVWWLQEWIRFWCHF